MPSWASMVRHPSFLWPSSQYIVHVNELTLTKRTKAHALDSTYSWSNRTSDSSIFIPFDNHTAVNCTNSCAVLVSPRVIPIVSTIYTHVVATEIITIQRSLGKARTLTRIEQNNSSFTFPPNSLFFWPFADAVTDTVLTSYGTRLVS